MRACVLLFCHLSRKRGVRYIYYTQMFLLAVAMISLTLFLVCVTSTIKDCYDHALKQVYEPLNITKIPSNSSFYDYDEDYCYEILRNAVSQNSITTVNLGLRIVQLRHNLGPVVQKLISLTLG